MTGHTKPTKIPEAAKLILIPLTCIGLIMLLMRFIFGLNLTNMNDGYPWGLWIVFDVIITALGASGYSMAILIYLFNKWKYHSLLKSAILISMIGYSLAGISVIIDLGRWWNFFSILKPFNWNFHSVMLEVALCIMSYTIITMIEFSPVLAEKAIEKNKFKRITGFIKNNRKLLNKILIFIVSLGILLPTMHQSSIGTIMVIAGSKLHPLWHTAFIPVFYILSTFFMGYSIVIIGYAVTSKLFKKNGFEKNELLTNIGSLISIIAVIWVILRLLVTIFEGKLAVLFSSGYYSVLYIFELIIVAAAALLIMAFRVKRSLKITVSCAAMLLTAGALYRLNSYLVAFNPGKEFFYFPSSLEILSTAGIFTLAIFLYLVLLKYLPVLPPSEEAAETAYEKPDYFASSGVTLVGKKRYVSTTVIFTMVFVITAIFIRFSNIPLKADNPVKKSVGWNILKIDGNRNEKFVKFTHIKHQTRIGKDKKKCKTCHHLSLPKDGPSSCYICHTDMERTTSMFDHHYHAKFHAEKKSCRECHIENNGQKQDIKPCGSCHKTSINEIQYNKDVQYYLNTRSYRRAMHGKCLSCHKTEDKRKGKIALSKCIHCHGKNL